MNVSYFLQKETFLSLNYCNLTLVFHSHFSDIQGLEGAGRAWASSGEKPGMRQPGLGTELRVVALLTAASEAVKLFSTLPNIKRKASI